MNDNFRRTSRSGSIHEGASTGRRLQSWGTRKTEPTQEVSGDLEILRERARTLRRDNSWTAKGVIVDGSNVVGTGIVPVPKTDNKELNETISEYWKAWLNHADYMGSGINIYGIQLMMRKAKRESGEAFLITKRLRVDRTSDNPVPLQFQMLESDYCPISLTKNLSNGRTIVNGIELDAKGRITAYYFYKQHPNVNRRQILTPSLFIRVPKKDVFHYFDQERPNQLRGRPQIATSIVTSRGFDMYNDSELVRKDVRSSLTGTIEREAYDERDYKFDPMSGAPLNVDDAGVPEMNLEAGTFHALLAGEKINLFDGDDSGSGYKDYQTFQLMSIAASHGIPYQLLTGDWSSINDRVWRAIFNQYKRDVQQDQELSLIPKLCDKIYRAFVERLIVANIIDVSGFKHVFQYMKVQHKTQAWEYIHPEQDVNAEIKRMQAGLTSRTSIIAKRGSHGETAESIDAERITDRDREELNDLQSLANNTAIGATATQPNPPNQHDNEPDNQQGTVNK